MLSLWDQVEHTRGGSRSTGYRLREAGLDTSMRKLELYRPVEVVAMLARAALHPRRALRERRYLDAWRELA